MMGLNERRTAETIPVNAIFLVDPSQVYIIEPIHKNVVRFAHNWNTGILERWNDGFSCTAMLSVSKKILSIGCKISETLEFVIRVTLLNPMEVKV